MLFYYHYNLIHFYRLKKALPRHGNIPATASHPFGAGRAVFGPVRLRLERGPTLAAAFHFIPVFDDFGVQGSVQWEDGCLKPPAQQRIGNALYANTFLAIVQ